MIRQVGWNHSPSEYDEFLKTCGATPLDQLDADDLVSVSFHANPHVPWSNDRHAQLAQDILAPISSDDLITMIRPNLLAVNRPNKRLARLAQSGVNLEILQEDGRQKWKLSLAVGALGTVWPLISRGDGYSVVVPFLLTLFDDYEAKVKLQSCYLLKQILDTHAKLIHSFKGELIELVNVCLNYIPTLTPEAESSQLLLVAWPCAIELATTPTEMIQLVGHLLSLISHLTNEWKLMGEIVQQLGKLVAKLGPAVFVLLGRINFVCGQLLINPFVVDNYEDGLGLVLSILELQQQIICMADDDLGKEILEEYRFDFSGGWITIQERVEKLTTPYKQMVDRKLIELRQTPLWIDI